MGAGIVRHPGVGMVSLTGDVGTGREVAKAASTTLKRVHLELGGKAPVVVFDECDLESTVEGIKVGALFNSGQDCTAATRVLVSERRYDDFLGELVAAVEKLKVGDPRDPATEMGLVVSSEQLERVGGFVERAVLAGGEVVTGGGALGQEGFWYMPTGSFPRARPRRSSSGRSSAP